MEPYDQEAKRMAHSVGETHPYERLSEIDPHIKTRMQYPGKMRGPKGGEDQRIAKRRAANKAARKQKRK